MVRKLAVVAVAVLSLIATIAVAPVPAGASVQGLVSDDFASGDLGAAPWTVVDPVGDGQVSVVGAGTSDAHLRMSLPAGTSHDPWGTNGSLRVMQPAADVDFEVETRWVSVPSQKYQMQGLIVEQDAGNWMRFDVHSTGSSLRLFASRTVNGSSSQLFVKSVSAGEDVRLKVTRNGSSWAFAHATGSQPWTTAATVSHALAVTSVGPFVGTSGTRPAWTGVLDWFFDTAAPIVPEDGQVATLHDLTTSVAGEGTVTRSPDAQSYVEGAAVELTAQPAAGWQFDGWSGDASGTAATTTVTMSGPRTVVATFSETPQQPPPGEEFALTLTVQGEGTVTASPSAATYAAGTVVTLTAAPDAGWTFTGWSGDAQGSQTSVDVVMDAARSVTAAFTASEEPPTESPPGPSGVVSDDFSTGGLAPQWSVVDPKGDGDVSFVGVGTTDSRLALTVPAGSVHDPWGSTNTALRIMQPIADGDFQVATRFTSAPTAKYQMQGILVEQDAGNWMRFDVHSTGTTVRAYAARTVNGASKQLLATTVPASPETTLRLTRTGDEWMLEYSLDGATWGTAGTVSHALTAQRIGPFVGNSGTKPAFTAEVDWFFDTASPVDPEDAVVADTYPLTTTVDGQGTVARSPSAAAYVAGTQVDLVAQPAAGWAFSHWTGDLAGTSPTGSVTMDAPRAVQAYFAQLPSDPPTIDVWYGDEQTFGTGGQSQRWVNVLGNASDANGVTSLTYSLNGGATTSLRLGPDLRRLYGEGDFNVQLDYTALVDGPNSLVLTATDGLGETATKAVTVVKSVQPTTVPRTVTWQEGDDPHDSAQVVDGKWSVGPDGLTVQEMGYDRTIAIGDMGWTDFEVTVPVTVRGLGPGAGTPQSGVPLVGLGLHWIGHSQKESEDPYIRWWPTGAFAWYEWYGSGRFTLQGNEGQPLVRKSMAWDFPTTYVMKARAEQEGAGVRYSYKWWPLGQVEPAAWALSVVEDAGPQAGSVLLVAHHVDATFGSVVVTELP